MPKIIIDGKEYETSEGRNLLEAALDNDVDVPYFCYHSALGAVGSCRLCAVKAFKDKDDKKGRLVMSCMEPATDGRRISIKDKEAETFRKSIVELLMINHPHDCPICDEGGECHLQDMTVMTGHRERRFHGKKRTYNNQYLGPLINHEMNRCIQCYRCVRYYQDYAGGDDLVVLASRNRIYFGRHEDGVLENPFAGNLIDICPTGVFTDKTLKDHYVRKWDQETAPSVCTQCGVGCNTLPGARYGKVRRILPRYNEEVNGYFICDRGRFGYEYNNSSRRLREPKIRMNGEWQQPERDVVWDHVKSFCQGGKGIAAIGSPRTSLETNFALKTLVGTDYFSSGLSASDHMMTGVALQAYQQGSATTPTRLEIEAADAIFVIAADVTHELPLTDLAVRQAVKKGASLWNASCRRTPLSDISTASEFLAPSDMLTSAMQIRENLFKEKESAKQNAFAGQVTTSLSQAERPLIIVGWYHGLPELFEVAASIAEALREQDKQARLLFAFPEANQVGVGLLGGLDIESVLARIEAGDVDRLIVAENDLFDRLSDQERLQDALAKLDRLLVLSHQESQTGELASEVIPITTDVESNGTWVNAEGRAQRAYQVHRPEPWVPEAWEVLRDLPDREGKTRSEEWLEPDLVLASLAAENPVFQATTDIAPPPSYRQQGQKIARMAHRFSGRMAMPSIEDVRDHLKPPEDAESPFAFSMEGSPTEPPSSLIPRYWAPNWNSQEAINKYQIELGKGLHSGAPDKRLFDGDRGSEIGDRKKSAFDPRSTLRQGSGQAIHDSQNVTNATPKKGQILLIPAAEIFGSERLSRQAAAIAELIPTAYLELHPETAGSLQVAEGDVQPVSWDHQTADLVIRFNDSVPRNLGIVPVGFPETRHLQAPQIARVGGSST